MKKTHLKDYIKNNLGLLDTPKPRKLEEQIVALEAKIDYLYAMWLQLDNENRILKKRLEKYEQV